MRVPSAYLAVIVIWSTTPLAIKWSGEGVGFLFGALSRMLLGLLCVLLLCLARRQFLRLDRRAWLAYGAAAVGILPAMLSTYWGAQFIPSGWISIVFGLSPLLTAGFAALLLDERSVTPARLLALACGLAGLALVFHSGFALGRDAVLGLSAILFATTCHAASAVLLKRLAVALPPLTLVAGGLLCAVPGYALCWWLFDGTPPSAIPSHALGGILYLGTIATAAGFSLYYFVLHHLAASQVALIALISPLAALLLGAVFNGEPLGLRTLAGALLVLAALALHELLPGPAAGRTRGQG
jgi:drug/metabolite transporter (DMT)-like permease